MSIERPTLYELQTYEGRKISDHKDLGGGYCGSCGIDTHIEQLNNGAYKDDASRWFKVYVLSLVEITITA